MDESTAKFATVILSSFAAIVSLYSLYLAKWKLGRELRSRFFEQINSKRMSSYPELWRITSAVYRKSESVSESTFTREWATEFHDRLWGWYYDEGNGIFLSESSKKAFSQLQHSLWDYDEKDGRQSVKEKVNTLRGELRAELRIETIAGSLGI